MLVFFDVLQFLSALLMIVLVLMHSAKGDGLAGIGASAQLFKSSSKLEKGLNITTWICGLVYLSSSALISWGVLG